MRKFKIITICFIVLLSFNSFCGVLSGPKETTTKKQIETTTSTKNQNSNTKIVIEEVKEIEPTTKKQEVKTTTKQTSIAPASTPTVSPIISGGMWVKDTSKNKWYYTNPITYAGGNFLITDGGGFGEKWANYWYQFDNLGYWTNLWMRVDGIGGWQYWENTSNSITSSGTNKSSSASYDNYDISEYLNGDTITVHIYTVGSTLSYDKWQDYGDYEIDNTGSYDYGIKQKISLNEGKGSWIYYNSSGSERMFILETSSDNVKRYKNDKLDNWNGVYSIESYLEDGIYLIGTNNSYQLYEFNDGICNYKPIHKAKFNKNGKLISGYSPDIDLSSTGFLIYTSEEFDEVLGTLDKEEKEYLYSGYWILDNQNNTYSLYYANGSGKSSIKIQNKNAYDLLTEINKKGYTEGAVVKDSSNTIISSSNVNKSAISNIINNNIPNTEIKPNNNYTNPTVENKEVEELLNKKVDEESLTSDEKVQVDNLKERIKQLQDRINALK